jgi:hypothetical protein
MIFDNPYTCTTKPYSNVRLFLWTLGGDIGWSFDGMSVKSEIDFLKKNVQNS